MFHFLPIAVRYDGSQPEGGDGYQVHVGPMYSDARGTLKIVSRDPTVHPALRFNYLSTDQDRQEWVESIRVARNILNQPAMAPFNGGEISPGPSVDTDEVLDWVSRDAETALHPSCTAKMGTDAMSVTDPQTMGVHGVDGLKVVDAIGDAVLDEQQHLRPGDDGGGKGCRPDSRQRAAGCRDGTLLPAPAQQPAQRLRTIRPQLIRHRPDWASVRTLTDTNMPVDRSACIPADRRYTDIHSWLALSADQPLGNVHCGWVSPRPPSRESTSSRWNFHGLALQSRRASCALM